MSAIDNPTCQTSAVPQARAAILRTCISGLLAIIFLLAVWPARSEGPEEDYLNIFGVIQQADSLVGNAQPGPALAKYRQAQAALQNFRRTYPDWNARMVAYRWNYLEQKIAGLSEGTGASNAVPVAGASGSGEERPKTKAATPSSMPQVKLLETGAEPRQLLRLHPKPGDKQTLAMTMNMAMEMKMGDTPSPAMKLPATTMTMEVTVKSVSEEGDIRYDLVIADAAVSDEPEAAPQVAEAMKSALASIKGVSGTGIMSSRGFSKGTELHTPPGADAQIQNTMKQMQDSFSQLSAPFPEEPVGPGARWEARVPLKSQGMTIEQTSTYKLASIEGERLSVTSTLTQRASKQKIQNPTMPGMKMDLDKMTGSGTGEMKYDLARLLPQGTTEGHSEMSMSMDMGGQKQSMNMKLDVKAVLETK
jgi:hypothetical protein